MVRWRGGGGKKGDIGHYVIVGGRWVPQEGARGRDYHRNSESVPDPEWFMQLDMQSDHATTLHFYPITVCLGSNQESNGLPSYHAPLKAT